jgi:hypothetical protein
MAFTPFQSGQDIVRQSVQTQYQLFQSITGKFLNASMQMAELNREASRKLLEESAADFQKVFQIKSIPDAQAFIGEQTKGSLEKVRGYWLNVQTIAAQTLTTEGLPAVINNAAAAATAATDAVVSSAATVSAAATQGQAEESKPAATTSKQHDADPAPSPLVEKLIATVTADAAKTGAQH